MSAYCVENVGKYRKIRRCNRRLTDFMVRFLVRNRRKRYDPAIKIDAL